MLILAPPSTIKLWLYFVNNPYLFRALCSMREKLCPVRGTPWTHKALSTARLRSFYMGFPGSLIPKEYSVYVWTSNTGKTWEVVRNVESQAWINHPFNNLPEWFVCAVLDAFVYLWFRSKAVITVPSPWGKNLRLKTRSLWLFGDIASLILSYSY